MSAAFFRLATIGLAEFINPPGRSSSGNRSRSEFDLDVRFFGAIFDFCLLKAFDGPDSCHDRWPRLLKRSASHLSTREKRFGSRILFSCEISSCSQSSRFALFQPSQHRNLETFNATRPSQRFKNNSLARGCGVSE